MKINISPTFVLVWTAVYFFESGNMFLPVVVSVAVHELFHLLALNFVGGKAETINFRLLGLEIVCGNSIMSYPKEFICAAAGPLGSLVFAICAAKMGEYVLSGVNITLFLFNILPVKPLDGGKMLYSLCSWILDDEKAEKIVFISTMGVIVFLAVLAIWLRQLIFAYFAVIAFICSCKIGKSGVKFQVKR